MSNFIIRGDLCWSRNLDTVDTAKDSFIVCIDGKSAGVFPRIPEEFAALPVLDYRGNLITPGLADIHTHAPQFAFRGLGMDLELLDWLQKHAFPEEVKYANLDYARKAYDSFVKHLIRGPNTRMVIFATLHVPATLLLMDMLEESGLVSLVGKVNMDRNTAENLQEKDAQASLDATEEWLDLCGKRKYINTKPILTPRFIPSCSDELMQGLGALRCRYKLPVQSHLCENRSEVEWVKQLCPESSSYSEAYYNFDLFDPLTIMAHCVWPQEKEIALMAKQRVYVAHCPQSNANLASGIAPVRQLLQTGVHVGLGSDIAGGANCSIFRAMSDAIQVSKLRQTLFTRSEGKQACRPDKNTDEKALSTEEAFYLGSASGGSFFGKAGMGYSGSFEKGFDFDALVINDSDLAAPFELTTRERLERVIYLSDSRHIESKFVRGKKIF